MNIQIIEKKHHRADGTLDVHSIFNTIQGEGPFCGHRATFIRLGGCNLQCPGCDTIYTGEQRVLMEPLQILNVVEGISGPRLIVLTGGEPLRQNVSPLIQVLVERGYDVQVETNGTLLIPEQLMPLTRTAGLRTISGHMAEVGDLFIVVSPKTGKVHKSVADASCAFKYVISHDDFSPVDLLPNHALDHTAEPYLARPPQGYDRAVYIQPRDYGTMNEWKNKQALENAVLACQQRGYILQLQVHKLIGVE